MISPFNLVMFFSIFSVFSLLKIIFNEKSFFENKYQYLIFIVATILGFYSDYSFFYLFFFFFFALLISFLQNKKRTTSFLLLMLSYMIIIVFILPGIVKFFENFSEINFLFVKTYNQDPYNFISFIKKLSQMIILNKDENLAFIYLFALAIVSFFVSIIKNSVKSYSALTKINLIFILSFLSNIIFVFFFSQNLFNLLIERSFWFFFLSLSAIITIDFFILLKKGKKMAILACCIIIKLYLYFKFINFANPGSVKC
jgi:hypothetical protein